MTDDEKVEERERSPTPLSLIRETDLSSLEIKSNNQLKQIIREEGEIPQGTNKRVLIKQIIEIESEKGITKEELDYINEYYVRINSGNETTIQIENDFDSQDIKIKRRLFLLSLMRAYEVENGFLRMGFFLNPRNNKKIVYGSPEFINLLISFYRENKDIIEINRMNNTILNIEEDIRSGRLVIDEGMISQ